MQENDETSNDEIIGEADNPYETDYELGQDNVRFWGFDLHNPVFFVSAALILLFVSVTLLFQDSASSVLLGARDWVLSTLDWFFVSTINIVLLLAIAIGLSPLGKIRLGGEEAQPEFSLLSWLAMLFSAGMGIGMVFYGAAEPLAYYTDWSGTPYDVTPGTPEAERLAFSATLFHWGLAPWSVYAIVGLSLAFFTFNKGLPLTIRSAFYPLLGERIWGWPGHVIDLLAVIATIFGLATSLGLGAQQATQGLEILFGLENTTQTQIFFILGITSIAIISVVRGLEGGIRLLSNTNIIAAIGLLIFVIAAGPTLEILSAILINTRNYIVDMPKLSSPVGRGNIEWYRSWTIFYWAWWISWSPFVGMFIARVSRGRTIRQFLTAVLVVPTLAAICWFTAFGKIAINQTQANVGELADGVTEVSTVLFDMLALLPFGMLASGLAVALLIVFFVTSSDSGSLVIDSITAGGKLHAPVAQRIFWATMEGLIAIVLLVGGGATALGALQAGAVTAGLPFTFILLACSASLIVGLMRETP